MTLRIADLFALASCVVIILALVALAGCVTRAPVTETPPTAGCDGRLHQQDVKWARLVLECRKKLELCEFMESSE